MTKAVSIVPFERIVTAIYVFRGEKAMLDRDLAQLYGVPTKALKQAVKRNLSRFPSDFMFELSARELTKWRSQFVTSKADRMGLRHAPMAFTEQGIAMLSSVLNSVRAIEVNIAIVRTFVQLRKALASQSKLGKRMRELEQQVGSHHKAIGTLFDAMQQLTAERPSAIGFQYACGDEDNSSADKVVKERSIQYRTTRRVIRGRKKLRIEH
jgi:hypothetical protein